MGESRVSCISLSEVIECAAVGWTDGRVDIIDIASGNRAYVIKGDGDTSGVSATHIIASRESVVAGEGRGVVGAWMVVGGRVSGRMSVWEIKDHSYQLLYDVAAHSTPIHTLISLSLPYTQANEGWVDVLVSGCAGGEVKMWGVEKSDSLWKIKAYIHSGH